MENNTNILKAHYPFSCPICGHPVKKGDNYCETEGAVTCLCVLPVRRLRPLISIRTLKEKRA